MKISNEVKTGILGVIAIVVFVLGYNFLRGTGIFSNKKVIRARFDNVQGLVNASNVQLSGVNVGLVNEIEFNPKNANEILVSFTVNKEIQIPKNTKAIIFADGLMGGKAIRLELGNDSKAYDEADILNGEMEYGMLDGVKPIVNDLKKTIASLDTVVGSIKNVLDAETQKNIQSAVANVSSSMADVQKLAKELGAQKGKITSIMNSLGNFSTNLNKNNASINNIVSNADKTTKKLSEMELQQTVNKLESTLNDLQQTIQKINSGTGSMALLMNDDKLYKNLKNTMETVNNLIYDISARPKRYINFSVFGKKDKNDSPPLLAPNTGN